MGHLPNADKAIIVLEKLRDYCLNPDHPVGKHKARVFKSALGFSQEAAPRLRQMILQAISVNDALENGTNIHGSRYVVDFQALGDKGQVTIRTAWIIDLGETVPRLTSCYIVRS